ncbi:hypothetical protein TgHK011_000633 [Trichoderma gracile]|nr:hypothetical protein TgHK011_000633 [Trichoderma gracile]
MQQHHGKPPQLMLHARQLPSSKLAKQAVTQNRQSSLLRAQSEGRPVSASCGGRLEGTEGPLLAFCIGRAESEGATGANSSGSRRRGQQSVTPGSGVHLLV